MELPPFRVRIDRLSFLPCESDVHIHPTQLGPSKRNALEKFSSFVVFLCLSRLPDRARKSTNTLIVLLSCIVGWNVQRRTNTHFLTDEKGSS